MTDEYFSAQVNYWDDGDGFHVAGNTLPSESDVPEPVTETPEVAAARLQHEASHAQALQAALLAGNGYVGLARRGAP